MSVWLIAIILGLVEGLTEFIPVSSTGHLLVAEHFLDVGGFFKTEVFNAVIQCGAVLAALPLFSERLATVKRWREPHFRAYFLKLGVAFGITAVGGLLMKKMGLRLPESTVPVAVALLVGGILFIVVEYAVRKRNPVAEVTWTVAIAIGAAQLVAVAFPGSSRSGSTILFALLLGLGRGPATEFSFLLGVPTLCAAGALKLLESLKAGGAVLEQGAGSAVVKTVIPMEWGPLVVACVVAAISSVLAVKWMLGYVRSHTFIGFGWYRIAMALVLLAINFAGGSH
jgi:undecaprenyl-diphosphatase